MLLLLLEEKIENSGVDDLLGVFLKYAGSGHPKAAHRGENCHSLDTLGYLGQPLRRTTADSDLNTEVHVKVSLSGVVSPCVDPVLTPRPVDIDPRVQ